MQIQKILIALYIVPWILHLNSSEIMGHGGPGLHTPGTYIPSLTYMQIKNKKLPGKIITYNSYTDVRSQPGPASPLIDVLAFGTEVSLICIKQGEYIEKSCNDTPYDGCIAGSDIWCHIRFKNKKGTLTQGFSSLVNFTLPKHMGAGKRYDYTQMYHYKKYQAGSHFRLDEYNQIKLPTVKKPSFFNKHGLDHYTSKIVLPTGEIIVSRKELEHTIRTSYPDNKAKFYYDRTIVSDYTYNKKDYPYLYKTISFQPGLAALLLSEDTGQLIKIDKLEAVGYFTNHPLNIDWSIPIKYKAPVNVQGQKIIMLLTKRTLAGIDPDAVKKIKIHRNKYNAAKTNGIIEKITVDINSDGQTDIFYCHYYAQKNKSTSGYFSQFSTIAIFMLYKGMWYQTAYKWDGDDGDMGH